MKSLKEKKPVLQSFKLIFTRMKKVAFLMTHCLPYFKKIHITANKKDSSLPQDVENAILV